MSVALCLPICPTLCLCVTSVSTEQYRYLQYYICQNPWMSSSHSWWCFCFCMSVLVVCLGCDCLWTSFLSHACSVCSWWLHMVLLLSPEQATSSTGVTPQRPAPTLHEPCLDERSLGERGEEGVVFYTPSKVHTVSFWWNTTVFMTMPWFISQFSPLVVKMRFIMLMQCNYHLCYHYSDIVHLDIIHINTGFKPRIYFVSCASVVVAKVGY